MDSTDRSNCGDLNTSQIVVQQYAQYPPTLESTLQSASSLGSARSQNETNKSPQMHRKETPRSLRSSPRVIRSAIPPSSTQSGPSMSPPVFDPMRQHQGKDAVDHAESRGLPSREITDETIDDAYVMFILYCNPNVPSSVDKSELRKTFRCPPRSDGKSFSVFTLFELIRKLESKELKTWIQLAIELGVEPPSMEKKQSTQKVQQYAVRLKRWMRAMHVDAFFEYCLGHPHSYFTQLPPSGPFVSEIRDGVALEEDLAIRALVPQWKPKRGRKRADERESEEDKSAKRPSLDTSAAALQQSGFHRHSVTFPQSAIPFSAFPDDDPWMTATTSFPPTSTSDQQPQDLRWRLPDREVSPVGYPQSAIIPRGTQPSQSLMHTEPRSAVTPSSSDKNRSKRKHGPAVSSAWTNNSGLSVGKSRGRPPNKPSTGSFSTFHVNQSRESSQVPQIPTHQSSPFVVDQHPSNPVTHSSYNQSPTPQNNGRPSKLQLQVPQHMGAPVRLASPPALLVNGVNGAVISQGLPSDESPPQANNASAFGHNGATNFPEITTTAPKISMDDIIRILSNELFRARITGRALPFSAEEAHSLASAMIGNLSTVYSQLPIDIFSIFLVLNLGMGHHFGFTNAKPMTMFVHVENTYGAPHDSGRANTSNELPGGTNYRVSFEYKPSGHFSMQILLGNLNPGSTGIGLRANSVTNREPPIQSSVNNALAGFDLEDDDLDQAISEGTEVTWRQRYLKLRAQMQKKDRALSQYKRKIVESVMADI
ncbi:ARS binding protein 2 [Penicillium taxi]|uniref:ARS binding protein 2 n=1 Tax=Penicillium taxi TaxID=168475 RepID=UPI0025459C71|nr:ARS binding protein 2 [Penicillium taxi]KAJ5887583.1 ARS binding protein 2 [Penicillium taxi]